jgi:hypothetical protein
MTDIDRTAAILKDLKMESAWDFMMEFMKMSELERSLFSIQMHLLDVMNENLDTDVRRIEMEHAWHELAQVMYDLAKERKDGE